jgi:hypothetical protein
LVNYLNILVEKEMLGKCFFHKKWTRKLKYFKHQNSSKISRFRFCASRQHSRKTPQIKIPETQFEYFKAPGNSVGNLKKEERIKRKITL